MIVEFSETNIYFSNVVCNDVFQTKTRAAFTAATFA
jgi:hypothetical protein